MSDRSKTGIVYHPDFLKHTSDSHPENKERVITILEKLEMEKRLENLPRLAPEAARAEEIAKIHLPRYIENIRSLCERGYRQLDADTYLTPDSYEAALMSAGGAVTAMRAVMGNKVKAACSLGRPPGHHAEPHHGMGFCLFNNGAVAAKLAMEEYGLKRILYVDWDVHHGNGTQKAFYHNKEILFISVHQSPCYPGTGFVGERGEGEGLGYTVNIPLPPGSGDNEYRRVFREIIQPLADRYEPELVLISAGQDAWHEDPVAGMCLTFQGYADMALTMKQIADKHCDGKTVLVLEGGYHLEGAAEALLTVLGIYGGWDRPVKLEKIMSEPYYADPDEIIAEVKRTHDL